VTTRVERSLSKRSTISSDDYEGLDESLDESNFYAPSSLPSSTLECHDVDVENNIAIWVPPPPQDEADERAMYLANDDDDDDDENNEIGWGNLTSSEYRNKEKATAMQDQRRAMRAVVDGHFKALVAQLLEGEGLDAYKREGTESNDWLEIVPMLATQAAKLIKPDTSRGGGMDPGGYVKIRCVASGHRSDR
jgi:1-phosphatidylinositol-3-phosphate 5-kinase